MTSIYILMQVVVTLQEMCRQGMVDYVSNFNSIANLVLLIFLVIYVYYAASVVVDELDRDVTDNFQSALHIIEIFVVFVINL